MRYYGVSQTVVDSDIALEMTEFFGRWKNA
jgi:hypothetical protein